MKNIADLMGTINKNKLFSASPMQLNKLYEEKTGEAFLSSSKWYGATTDIEVWEKKSVKKGIYGYDICLLDSFADLLGGVDVISAYVPSGTKMRVRYGNKVVISLRGEAADDDLIRLFEDCIAWAYVIQTVESKKEAVNASESVA